MPTENYSHMVMESKHMVAGDGVDDDGDEEALKISSPTWRAGSISPQKQRLWWWCSSS
jgi:hypothetical protein